ATAAYLQYRWKMGAVTVYPGVRYEHVTLTRLDYGKEDPERKGTDLLSRSNTVDALLPGISVELMMSPTSRLIGGMHKGFAPPGSNEGARPEASVNYEIGWRQRKGVVATEVIGFFHHYMNLLGTDLGAAGGSGSTDTYNGGKARAGGVEFLLSSAFLSRHGDWYVPVSVSYTYTAGAFGNSFESGFEGWGTVEEGDALPYLAPHRLTLETGLVHPRVSVYLTASYSAAMRTQAGKGALNEAYATDEHIVIDLAVQAPISDQITFFSTVRNLANSVYVVARRPAGARPGLPRSVEIGMEGRF
ncbi:MAG: TonB-dependent receptor, partial [Saprospiraceae bacterium]|nr:TonB-dependent receptor [Saprospiraceae bacterium]